ncbi:MAG: glycosyltransferase family 4 protein [Verrucomicrobiota bacterium]
MKILLLNQTFYPDVVSTAQHLSELATALVKRGHQVTVVTGRRAYDHPGKFFPAQETWRGVRIVRVWSTRFGKKARWHRAVDFATFLLSCCARLLWLPRAHLVVALTTPPLMSFIAAWRAKLWRSRFAYWVMDLNPDEAVAAGWLRADSSAGKALERMSRFSFRQADSVIALDRFMAERIAAKGIPREKIAIIPPWAHDNDVRFDAAGREGFRRAHGLDSKFVVMYSGNHSPVHPLDTLMQAAELLQNESIVFCFVGGGSEFERVKQWAASRNRRNILCLPYQPLNLLSGSLSGADAQVVVMGNAFVGLVHPCKIYNILTVGAPVIYIGPQPGHVTEILDSLSPKIPGCTVSHGAADILARQILELKSRVPANRSQASLPDIAGFSKNTLLPRLIAALEQEICPDSVPEAPETPLPICG